MVICKIGGDDMAVIRSEREESEIAFLYNARQLQIYSIKKCLSFPKRYTFFVSQPLANVATRIHQYAKIGNSINPTNRHEAQMRIDYFLKAKAETNNMVSQIELTAELFDFDKKEWMRLVYNQIKLLEGIIKYERTRYRKLPL